jgi:hypothetical protein
MTLPAPLDRLAEGPVFIFGRARSGTSWVYDMFHAHPQVAGVFESWIFTQTRRFTGSRRGDHAGSMAGVRFGGRCVS